MKGQSSLNPFYAIHEISRVIVLLVNVYLVFYKMSEKISTTIS